MPWKKGQSGNPNGAPPKSRALTAILERAGGRSVVMPDGKKMTGKRFLAQAMWELATSGKVTMPDGATWVVDPRDWIETVKWLYVHIDGPAKQQVDVTSNYERIGGDLTDEQRLAAIVAAFSAIGSGLSARAEDGPPVVDAAVRSTS